MSHRLIFTGGVAASSDGSTYIVGSNVGALNTSVRRALKRRANNNASGNPCCSTPSPSITVFSDHANFWNQLYSGDATESNDIYTLPANTTIVETANAYFNANSNKYYGYPERTSGPLITLTDKSNSTSSGYLFNSSGYISFTPEDDTNISWVPNSTNTLDIDIYITMNGSTQPYTYKILSSGAIGSTVNEQQYIIGFPI